MIDKIISINNNINNMTVQQLIDELNKVEDKSKIVLQSDWSDVDFLDITTNEFAVILM